MNWTTLDTWIVVAGMLSAASCALIGNFLVLRRMSLMGDAISHAVLPGLAAAFLISGSRGSAAMFIGAAIVGILTALFTQWIHTLGKVEESAAMGVVFTALFAAGLIMIVRAADAVDLDPGCVLYGAIELVPLDVRPLFGFAVPQAVVTLAGILLFNVLFTLLLYKELRISAFDPALATTLGVNATAMHYLLMAVVAVTTVASFESVGSILVIAMLIVPPCTAHLLSDRYGTMLVLSVILAMAAAWIGHVSAITVPGWFGFTDTSTAGMMAVAAGGLLGAALLFAPQHGIVSRVVRRTALSLRIAREDVLGLLYRRAESGLRAAKVSIPMATERGVSGAGGTGRWMTGLATIWLRLGRRIEWDGEEYRLTPLGMEAAGRVVRSHRLWESYVARYFELPVDHLHETAQRTEHYLTGAIGAALDKELKGASRDPHGKEIPQ